MNRTSSTSSVADPGLSQPDGAAKFAALRTDNPVAAPGGTVHVVDDDPAVRESLALLLDAAGFAVRTHPDAESLLAAAGALAPGCVLTDVRMPGMDGLALQRHLAAAGVAVPVVVMTGHADVPLAVAAMKAGAVDFLQKPFAEADLLAVLRQALARAADAAAAAAATAAAGARLAGLTPREQEVLAELVAGHPNKVIAQHLGASPRTIEVHRARVMDKLGVHSLPELVRLVQAARGAGAEDRE